MDLWGTFILEPMLNGLLLLYQLLFHNFTLSIVVFTILVRLLTFPLTHQQQQAAKKLTTLQQSEAWKKIQEKHAKDKEKLAQAQMQLYKQAGVNPFGSCLPMLIQLPILIGLYQAITQAMAASPMQLLDFSKHVYNWHFLPNVAALLPLDNRFLWLDLALPDPSYILPLLVTITTWLQSKVMTPTTAAADSQAAQMAQTMTLMMPVMFGWISLQFASGLSIYFIISNVIGIVQYSLTSPVNWREVLRFDLGGLVGGKSPANPTANLPAKKKKRP